MEKYKNENKVAVLVSHGFGAGWSTWNAPAEELATDRTLVEMALRRAPAEEVKAYCKEAFGNEPYMGGWGDVEVEWVDEGASFSISEYDGSESLETASSLCFRA